MNSSRALVVIAAARIDDDGHQWVEQLPVVEKARNGKFYFTVTRADLDAYGASIASQPGLIPVDYDHEGAVGGSTVAAGWFTGETQIVDAGQQNPAGETQDHTSLWARVKWTPQARQEILDGRFKRMSPEFSFQNVDTKTGLMTKAKEFLASTLTNRPFFTQLAALAAAGDVVWNPDDGYQKLQQELLEALNPNMGAAGDMTYRYWVCDIAVTGDRALIQETGPDGRSFIAGFSRTRDEDGDSGGYDITIAPETDWIEAQQEWVQVAADLSAQFTGREATNKENHMHESLKAIASELGLADDATDEQVLAAVQAAKTKPAAPADDQVVLSKDDHAKLIAGATAGLAAKTELDALKVATKLDGAVRAGKLTVAQRPSYEALAAVDIDAFSKAIDELPEGAFPVTANGHGGPAGGGGDGEPEADLEPVVIDGTPVPVDEATAKVHAAAVKDGKPKSQEELLEALTAAGYDETVDLAARAAGR